MSARLPNNPVKTLPRKLKVGITTTSVMDSILTIGKKVSDNTSSAAISGNIEQVGGNVANTTSNLVGAGYSNGTYTELISTLSPDLDLEHWYCYILQ